MSNLGRSRCRRTSSASRVTADASGFFIGQWFQSNIADADLREEPARLIATFLSRALFAQAREMKLDLMGVAKEVVAVSYADLSDSDKELSRQIACIMFPAFCAKVRRLYEVGIRQSRFMSTRP
jgi:hypothetical protein